MFEADVNILIPRRRQMKNICRNKNATKTQQKRGFLASAATENALNPTGK